jgi:glutamate racemase
MEASPIGIFDSGYGGLTVLKDIALFLPEYDYIYLGDNARAPYGNRSYETVYQFTIESVRKLFSMGCQLVILACNTSSAKALRTIQQNDLPKIDPYRRVLGVIRPIAEIAGIYSKSNNIGILGTRGTINSNSYQIEINKLYPHIHVYQEACPMWVSLIENNEHNDKGADYFIKKNISNLLHLNSKIDTIILGCTHYPLLMEKIRQFLPKSISIISQGSIVAESLKDYLFRHPEMESRCSKNGKIFYYTTDTPELFDKQAAIFLGRTVSSRKIVL